MKKPRHNPDKVQNKYGGDYDCYQYDTNYKGEEFCHDEGQAHWGEWIKWDKKDNNGMLTCKGNRHTCRKMYYKWLASMKNERKRVI